MRPHLLLQAYLRVHRKPRLTILIFHRVLEHRDPLRPGEPTISEFEARMRWVKANFTVLPLRQAVSRMRDERLPTDALAITFDDGYADNLLLAAPILSRLGLHATFFVATGFLDGGRMFNDSVIEAVRASTTDVLDLSTLGLGTHRVATADEQRAAISRILERLKYRRPREREECTNAMVAQIGAELPSDLMMSSDQVAALHSMGMGIGAHTCTHPILQSIETSLAEQEIRAGRERLEEIVGERIALFAYPNGRPGQDYGAAHVQLAKDAGFEAAVSTAWGAARSGCDMFQLPRFTPWDRSDWKFGLRMIKTLAQSNYALA